jgi:hypothetical protein
MTCADTAVVSNMKAAMLAARTTKASSGCRTATPAAPADPHSHFFS